jgi:hypothetical protein
VGETARLVHEVFELVLVMQVAAAGQHAHNVRGKFCHIGPLCTGEQKQQLRVHFTSISSPRF